MQLGLFEDLLSQSDKQSLILALRAEDFRLQAFQVIESSNNYRSIELAMADLLEQLDIVQGYSLRFRDFIRLIRQIKNPQERGIWARSVEFRVACGEANSTCIGRAFTKLEQEIISNNSQARKLILGWYYCPFSYFHSKNIEFLSSLSNP